MQKMRLITGLFFFFIFLFTPVFATEKPVLLQDFEATYLAKVISVTGSEMKDIPNTETKALYQTVTVQFIDGPKKSTTVTMTDSSYKVKVSDKVYIRYLMTKDGFEYYSISEPYRLPVLFGIIVIFFIALLFFGGKQGFLAILALFISFGGIFNFLFPQILNGGNIVVISTIVALSSLFVVMYLTHGFTRLTTAAFLGCVGSIVVTLFLAIYSVKLASLTGFSDDESVFLNLATKGGLDFTALLIGGIIIGVIGVIDDVSITQASVVNELRHANPNLSPSELYTKASNVGKNHVGAVINTLILVYTGASLPLVLLLYVSDTPILELINREAIAVEIIRTSIGSIGLLCAVPLTTVISIYLMRGEKYTSVSSTSHSHHHHHHHHH
jgi:uncharacterized membrane protein